jgi:hypothetical protein
MICYEGLPEFSLKALGENHLSKIFLPLIPAPELMENGFWSVPGTGARWSKGVQTFKAPYGHSLMNVFPLGSVGTSIAVLQEWKPVMESWDCYIEYKAGGRKDVADRELFDDMEKVALRFPGARKEVHSEDWHDARDLPVELVHLFFTVVDVEVIQIQNIKPTDCWATGIAHMDEHKEGVVRLLRAHEKYCDELESGLNDLTIGAFRDLYWTTRFPGHWESDGWAWKITVKRSGVGFSNVLPETCHVCGGSMVLYYGPPLGEPLDKDAVACPVCNRIL